MTTYPFVSIIVPAYNEADQLPECLESLCRQEHPNYEVILVDNASTDDTRRVCEAFPSVRYIYFDRCKSSYAARNEGVRQARGDLLVFFDADQTALPTFLRTLFAEYVPDDPYHVYHGRLSDDERMPRVLLEFFPWDRGGRPGAKVGTAAVGIPRRLYEQLGGFREDLVSCGDHEFFERAKKVATVHCPRQFVGTHYRARNLGEFFKREERYAFGGCLVARAEGRKPPTVRSAVSRLLVTAATKTLAAAVVPFRYPNNQWLIRWQAQFVHCRANFHRLIGIAKFHAGRKMAGDLPADAGEVGA